MSENKECPVCAAAGHDSDGDHLWLMGDGKRWCCNRTQYHDTQLPYYERNEVSPETESQYGSDPNELKSTLSLEVGDFDDTENVYSGQSELNQLLIPTAQPNEQSTTAAVSEPSGNLRSVSKEIRGISPATFTKFKVQEKVVGGAVVALEHEILESKTDKILARKGRRLDKKAFYATTSTGKGTSLQLFGQQTFKRAKRLLITEGELDAMSAYQMLSKWKVAVVSLPLGSNIKALMDNMDYLKGFKEIFISCDMDAAGEKVAKDIANLIPGVKVLKFSESDANDMMTKGKTTEFVSAFWDAEIYKPSTIIKVSDIINDVMKKPVMGEPWPWPTLTSRTYGRNPGQGMYVGAGVKIGKSEFIDQVVAFDIKRGKKIAILKYEQIPAMTIKRLAGKIDGTFYHRPGVAYSDSDLNRTAMSMEELLLMYPAFGPATWESTKEFVRYAALSGCETIIIDPITKLSNALDSSETESMLRTLSDELACMAQDMGFFYIVTCHLKAPYAGPPHERGGKVLSAQFRGSRAMMENCYYLMGIERNKDPDLTDTEINTSTFVLLEDRNFGNTVKFPVYYDDTNQSYLEPPHGSF